MGPAYRAPHRLSCACFADVGDNKSLLKPRLISTYPCFHALEHATGEHERRILKAGFGSVSALQAAWLFLAGHAEGAAKVFKQLPRSLIKFRPFCANPIGEQANGASVRVA